MFQCIVTGAQHTLNKKGLDMTGRYKGDIYRVVPVEQKPTFVIDKLTAKTYEGFIHARYLLQIGPDSF